MRIAIGTAQFNRYYGIRNKKKKKISLNSHFDNIKKIFITAKKNNINLIDTAINYKNSEKYLERLKINNFKIITKIPSIPKNITNIEEWIIEKILNHLKKIKKKKFWAILLHDTKILQTKKGKYTIKALQKIKRLKYCSKIGISIYDPKEFKRIKYNWKPDIVELPLNIFDRRSEKKNFLQTLKKNKTFIIARSVFLQGILLERIRPKYFKKWNKYFNKWFNWCDKNSIEPSIGALKFVQSFKEIDKIIIGFDNPEQLIEIIKNNKKKIRLKFPKINISDNKILNPYNWPYK